MSQGPCGREGIAPRCMAVDATTPATVNARAKADREVCAVFTGIRLGARVVLIRRASPAGQRKRFHFAASTQPAGGGWYPCVMGGLDSGRQAASASTRAHA